MISYKIDKQKRTVTAKLTKTRFDVVNEISKRLGHNESYVLFGTEFRSQLKDVLLPKCFTGKAVCNEKDEFNVDIGKQIAKQKCLDKYYKAKDNAYKNWLERAKHNISLVEDFWK